MKKVGFIGAGNMATAIIKGMMESKIVDPENLYISDVDQNKVETLKGKYHVQVCSSNKELAKTVDVLVLAIKPFMFAKVIPQIKYAIKDQVLVVSVAAGQTITMIEEAFGREMKIVRVMPNTPSFVNEGMAGIAYNDHVSKEEVQDIKKIFDAIGESEIIDESLIDAVGAVSGASPAYVYMFIEALADAGVKAGLARNQAYKFAAQAVLGSAKMVLETGLHPGALKDQVTSPRGSTIEGLEQLEKNNFRYAIMAAIDACLEKTEKMKKTS